MTEWLCDIARWSLHKVSGWARTRSSGDSEPEISFRNRSPSGKNCDGAAFSAVVPTHVQVRRRPFFVLFLVFFLCLGASKEFLQRFIVGLRFAQAFRSDYSMLPRSSSSPCHLLSKFSRQLLWQRALNKRLRIWMHMYACHLTMFLWSACVAWVWGSLSPSFVHLWDFAFLLVRNRKWFISSEENDNQWMEDIQSIFRDAQFMFFLCHSCERFDLNNKWMSW